MLKQTETQQVPFMNVISSRGILHLTVKDNAVLPDYLTLVLNSTIVRLQAERSVGGSIIQHWKQSEIENDSDFADVFAAEDNRQSSRKLCSPRRVQAPPRPRQTRGRSRY